MRRADICVVQIAECFRNDADILCNPIGISPIIGGRLAKATFANEVVMTDAVSVLAANILPLGDSSAERVIESYVPYRTCLLYTSPSPRDQRGSRMPSSA